MQEDLKVSYEGMRSLVVAVLARKDTWQIAELSESVAATAVERGLAESAGAWGSRPGRGPRLSARDYARAQSVFWDLLIEGVVRPGLHDGMNNDLPFFHVTDYGKEAVKGGAASPYDPDGFLRRLAADVPALDPVILTYLTEALHTFRISCLLSSVIALGCASEKAFLLLVKSYGDALQGSAQAKFRKDTEGRLIKRQFDEFQSRLGGHLRAKLPGDVEADLDVTLSGVFTLFRNLRNEAGHPTGRSVEREQTYANLLVFPSYLKKTYQVIEWLDANKPL